MTEPVSGPQPGDWLAAIVRALHPTRLIVSLSGVALTVCSLAVAESLISGDEVHGAGWWLQPVEQGRTFAGELAARSFLAVLSRVIPLVAVLVGVGGLAGAWIARQELLYRLAGRPYETETTLEPGPTALVARQLKNLLACGPTVLAMIVACFLPMLAAGLVNRWMGGVGAVLVAILLPLVLIGNLLVVTLVFGFFAWPLMPVTMAAENSDVFDGLSRSYNYALTRPIRFVLLNVVAIGFAAIPLILVLFPLADIVAGWPPAAGPICFWLAAALSVSLFWSLQTLVYLHLRASVDGTDPGEIATENTRKGATKAEPNNTIAETAQTPVATDSAIFAASMRRNIPVLILMIGTWFLTVWLFGQIGGDDSNWMAWGLGETFRPPARGIYGLASIIALVWGVAWVGFPVYVAIRGLFQPDRAKSGQSDPGP